VISTSCRRCPLPPAPSDWRKSGIVWGEGNLGLAYAAGGPQAGGTREVLTLPPNRRLNETRDGTRSLASPVLPALAILEP